MSVTETLAAAQAAGLRLDLDGTDLLIEADHEPPLEILDALRRDKPEILALLLASEIGEISPPATVTHSPNLRGVALTELEKIAGEHWSEIENDPVRIEALAIAIETRQQRERGEVPANWTQVCVCAGCGPVYLWPGSPARVLGCPWCLNCAGGRPVPRPVAVNCGNCRHFERIDHPHLGHCTVGEPEAIAGIWDTDWRRCSYWFSSTNCSGSE